MIEKEAGRVSALKINKYIKEIDSVESVYLPQFELIKYDSATGKTISKDFLCINDKETNTPKELKSEIEALQYAIEYRDNYESNYEINNTITSLEQKILALGFKSTIIEFNDKNISKEVKPLYVRVWFDFKWKNIKTLSVSPGWRGFNCSTEKEVLSKINDFINEKHENYELILNNKI